MKDLFLTNDELRRWSGKKWVRLQIAWLKAEGIPFRIALDGRPRVARAALEGSKAATPQSPRGWVPRVMGA
jgi:hypothetical protein